MTTIIVGLIVYIFSAFGCYKFNQYAYYHPKGKWVERTPKMVDVYGCFVPGANTLGCIIFILDGWRDKKYSATDFFKPKPKEK